jgi:hypothetical protein
MVEKLDSYNLVEESHLHIKNKGRKTFLNEIRPNFDFHLRNLKSPKFVNVVLSSINHECHIRL